MPTERLEMTQPVSSATRWKQPACSSGIPDSSQAIIVSCVGMVRSGGVTCATEELRRAELVAYAHTRPVPPHHSRVIDIGESRCKYGCSYGGYLAASSPGKRRYHATTPARRPPGHIRSSPSGR